MSRHGETTGGSRTAFLLFAAYVTLLVYGSLFPLRGWQPPDESIWRQFLTPERISRTDLLANALVYLPYGVAFAWAFAGRRVGRMALAAGVTGGILSLGLEGVQAFLPGRVSSVLDWVLNTLGATAGAVLGMAVVLERGVWRWVHVARTVVRPGAVADAGLVAVGVWALSQLAPSFPPSTSGTFGRDSGPHGMWFEAGLRSTWCRLSSTCSRHSPSP